MTLEQAILIAGASVGTLGSACLAIVLGFLILIVIGFDENRRARDAAWALRVAQNDDGEEDDA